jgi:hypothetical protein
MMAAALMDRGTGLLNSLGPADYFILGVALVAAVVGLWLGLLWMLVLVVSTAASIWVTLAYHPVVAQALGTRFNETERLMISAAAVFVGTMMVCFLLAFLLRGIVGDVKPQLTDRILGAVFGLFVAALMSAFVSFVIVEYSAETGPTRVAVEQSVLARNMGTCFRYALPNSLRQTVAETSGKDAD